MSLLTLVQELWRFIKQHFKNLIVGALIGMFFVLLVRYALGIVLLNRRDDSYQYLSHIYSQEPAEFQAIISLDDGQIFTNSNIYDEYLSSTAVVKEIEDKTGLTFGRWINDERNLDLREEGSYRGALAAVRDTSSDLITFRVLVGQNKDENLKIAQAYADFLTSEQMAFKDIHDIQITHEPEVMELLNLDKIQNVPTEKTLNLYAGMTPKNMVVFSFLGFIVGLLLAFIWAIYRMIQQPTINYAFEYSWDMDDDHLLMTNSEDISQNLLPFIRFPYIENRYILMQNNDNQMIHLLKDYFDSERIMEDIRDVSNKRDLPEEVVMLIHNKKTYKRWYKEQYQLVKRMKIPVKIIHQITD